MSQGFTRTGQLEYYQITVSAQVAFMLEDRNAGTELSGLKSNLKDPAWWSVCNAHIGTRKVPRCCPWAVYLCRHNIVATVVPGFQNFA
jgi:hypothetical protein